MGGWKKTLLEGEAVRGLPASLQRGPDKESQPQVPFPTE